MRVAVAQVRAGDDKAVNLGLISDAVADAAGQGAELVICP
jgi:predicted amidohydrolase